MTEEPQTQSAEVTAADIVSVNTTNEAEPAQPAEQAEKSPSAITPESFGEFSFTEGFEPDEALLSEFRGVAAEYGLSKEQAQKLVDIQNKASSAAEVAQRQSFDATVSEWAKQTAADPEIGGPNYEANIAITRAGLKAVAGPELESILNQTGLGNHPALVKAFFKVGKLLGSDSPVSGGGSMSERSTAEVLYPSMFKGNN